MGRRRTRAGQRGQATPEYVGLVLLVCVLLGALLAFGGLAGDGLRLGRLVAEKLVCAVRGTGCAGPADDLIAAYGPDVAALAREHAPEIRFEDADYVSLPVDPRSCRAAPLRRHECPGSERALLRGRAGDRARPRGRLPLRRPDRRPAPTVRARRRAISTSSTGSTTRTRRRGPGTASATTRDDWESYQVKIEPDGSALSRASSHHSYNYEAGRSPLRPRHAEDPRHLDRGRLPARRLGSRQRLRLGRRRLPRRPRGRRRPVLPLDSARPPATHPDRARGEHVRGSELRSRSGPTVAQDCLERPRVRRHLSPLATGQFPERSRWVGWCASPSPSRQPRRGRSPPALPRLGSGR